MKISFVLNYLSRGNYSLIILWEKHLLEKVFFQLLLKPNFKLLEKKNRIRTFLGDLPSSFSISLNIFMSLSSLFVNINRFLLRFKGFLRQEYINSFYDSFCHWLTRRCFLIEVGQILWKPNNFFGAKINQFLFHKKFLDFFHLL